MVRKIGKYISRRTAAKKKKGGSVAIAPRTHHDDDLQHVANKLGAGGAPEAFAQEILEHAMVKKGSSYNVPLYHPPRHEPFDIMALAHQIHADHFHEHIPHSEKVHFGGGAFGGGVLADIGEHADVLGKAISKHGHTAAKYGAMAAHKVAPFFGDYSQGVNAVASSLEGVSGGVWDVAGKAVSAGGYAFKKLDRLAF